LYKIFWWSNVANSELLIGVSESSRKQDIGQQPCRTTQDINDYTRGTVITVVPNKIWWWDMLAAGTVVYEP
jgi:hypothetical protein